MQKFLIVLLRFFFNYRPQIFFPSTTTPPILKTTNIKRISFFIVAHADDIELFMGKEAQYQIQQNSVDRMVFIVLSAGDANRKNRKKPLRKITWWQAREHSHTAAISSWNQYRDAAFEQQIQVNQKYLTKINMGDKICLYNFRLTDADKTTSLAQLVQQHSSSINDLTHNQAYSLDALQQSLLALLKTESAQAEYADFFIMDCDDQRNPEDHKDHQATSLILIEILKELTIPHKSLTGYLTYSTHNKPINLEGQDRENSFATWKLMGDVLEYHGYKRNDDPHHMQWVGKQYPSFNLIPDQDTAEINRLKKLWQSNEQ